MNIWEGIPLVKARNGNFVFDTKKNPVKVETFSMDFILSNVKNVCFPLFNPGLLWALRCLGASKINYISLVMQRSFKFPQREATSVSCGFVVFLKFTKGLSSFNFTWRVCMPLLRPHGIFLKLKKGGQLQSLISKKKKRLHRASVVYKMKPKNFSGRPSYQDPKICGT